MTMYLKLSPTPDTIVFSGDKRFIDKQGVSDNNLKATKLGHFSVGGATGSTRHVHAETKEVQRDVHALLASFFSDKEVTAETLAAFTDELKKHHDEYVEKHCKGKTLPLEGVFSIAMSTLEGGKVTDRVLRADIVENDKLAVHIYPSTCSLGNLSVHGDRKLREALQNRDQELAVLYQEADIERLLLDPSCPFGLVIAERAVAICRKIHKLCGERAEKITGKKSTVSPECDVLVVDAQGCRPAP